MGERSPYCIRGGHAEGSAGPANSARLKEPAQSGDDLLLPEFPGVAAWRHLKRVLDLQHIEHLSESACLAGVGLIHGASRQVKAQPIGGWRRRQHERRTV